LLEAGQGQLVTSHAPDLSAHHDGDHEQNRDQA
jgi:hypothetical protein